LCSTRALCCRQQLEVQHYYQRGYRCEWGAGNVDPAGISQRVVSVANALVTKGFSLGKMDRSEEALEVYDEVVARFGDAPEPELREQVAKALVNRGVTLGEIGVGRYDEAVAW
jgi:hypothetical protein